MIATLREQVEAQLCKPVPPPKYPEWERWKAEWMSIGPASAPRLLEALAQGGYNEQYSALLALRLFGYDACADGYGPEMVYLVVEPDGRDKTTIRPRITSRADGGPVIDE